MFFPLRIAPSSLHRARPSVSAIPEFGDGGVSGTPSLLSSLSVATRLGAPAQKIAIVNGSLLFRIGSAAAAFLTVAISQGLPTKTTGSAPLAIRPRASAGLACAYRDPAPRSSSMRPRLITVAFRRGSSWRAAMCATPEAKPAESAWRERAVTAPPEEPRCRISGSADHPSQAARIGPQFASRMSLRGKAPQSDPAPAQKVDAISATSLEAGQD